MALIRSTIQQRLALLEAALQDRLPEAYETPPLPTPEQMARCEPWQVLVGNHLITVEYEDQPPVDPMTA